MVQITHWRCQYSTYRELCRHIGQWMASCGRNSAIIRRWICTSRYTFLNINTIEQRCWLKNREWKRKLKLLIKLIIHEKNCGIELILSWKKSNRLRNKQNKSQGEMVQEFIFNVKGLGIQIYDQGETSEEFYKGGAEVEMNAGKEISECRSYYIKVTCVIWFCSQGCWIKSNGDLGGK